MNIPGLVSKGIIVCDVCEWTSDGDDYPEWKYSICSYKGHIFRWYSNGTLIEADDYEIKEATRELEAMVKHAETSVKNVINQLKRKSNRSYADYKICESKLGFYNFVAYFDAMELVDDMLTEWNWKYVRERR